MVRSGSPGSANPASADPGRPGIPGGSYGGASVANHSNGLRIALTRFGGHHRRRLRPLCRQPAPAGTHTFQEMRNATSAQRTIGTALAGVDIPEDSGSEDPGAGTDARRRRD